MGNPPFKFGHAWPLGSQIIRYVRDGQTDGQTKAKCLLPLPSGVGIKTALMLLRATHFCHVMRCISSSYVVMRCLCVCHVRGLCQNE